MCSCGMCVVDDVGCVLPMENVRWVWFRQRRKRSILTAEGGKCSTFVNEFARCNFELGDGQFQSAHCCMRFRRFQVQVYHSWEGCVQL